ncbi:MAG: phosphomethylpyrimidine synthase ThiC, partial [Clostridia bacterium]|nr:phosphomethylpyrimidine synthase ThiC [Clostridia bacterium]
SIISALLLQLFSLQTHSSHIPTIIASMGATDATDSLDLEISKAIRAVEVGATIVTDHTLLPDMEYIHEKIAEKIKVPFSAISVYEAAVRAKRNQWKIDAIEMIRIIEEQAKRGIDILTVHATALRNDIRLLNETPRLIPCTSRGGTMMLEILKATKQENPYWVYFDDVLDIAKKYNMTISLGTCFRPASVYDCMYYNDLYYMEMERMGKLVERADKKSVGIVIEGIGHAPINIIEDVVKKSKKMCHNAPYRILTVSTDIALGYDHIASAIGSANAVYYGADMITCVSRSEHIGLPSIDDLCEAVISAKIAAYVGFSARNNDFKRDKVMSEARNQLGCYGQIETAIYPEGAYEAILKRKIKNEKKECSMCGEFCALDANERLFKIKE